MNAVIVGLGNIGKIHLRNLKKNEAIKVFVSDKKELDFSNKIFKNTETINLTKKEILDNKIDFAIICTPTSTHFSIAKKLITLGIPVLIEKPLVLNKKSFAELYSLGHNHDVFVMCGFVERHHNVVKTLKNELQSQQLIFFSSTRYSLPPNEERILDSVKFDILIHDLDLLYYLNKNIKLKNLTIREMNETAFGVYSSKKFNASLSANRLSQHKIREITAITNEKHYVADLIENKLIIYKHLGVKPNKQAPYFKLQKDEKIINFENTESILTEQQYFLNNYKKGFNKNLFESYKFSHFGLFNS